MNGISWDYEETTHPHYHIFAVNGPLDGAMEAWGIYIPDTPENDADVQCIVDALERIASRLQT